MEKNHYLTVNTHRPQIQLIDNSSPNYQSNQIWEEVRTVGRRPSRRSYHSAIAYNNQMWIYGGQDLREGVLSGLWSINAGESEEAWEYHDLSTSPRAVCRHSAVVYNDQMFIFGGTNFIEEFSTMYIINLNTMICRTIDTKNDGMPYAVDSHTAILWEKDDAAEMIIFGGFVDGLRSNQLFSCDLTTLKWEQKVIQGRSPCERAGHSAILYQNCMYVFGGCNEQNEYLNDLWKLDLNTFEWQLANCTGQIPNGKAGHSAVVYGHIMLVFGGMKDIIKETNELFSFDLSNNNWILIQLEQAVNDPISLQQVEEFKTKKSPPKTESISPNSPLRTQSPFRNTKTGNNLTQPDQRRQGRKNKRLLYNGPVSPCKGRVKNDVPHARDGHSAVVINNWMYIFGGDRHQMPFNDLYAYPIFEDTIKTPVAI